MLMSLKEACHLFREEMKDEIIFLSKFCSLRPAHIRLFEQIPHNVSVCEYNKNIRLILFVLENHTYLSSMLDDFVQQVTCAITCKDCLYQHCIIIETYWILSSQCLTKELFSQNISRSKHAKKRLRRLLLLVQWMLFLMIQDLN